MDEYSENESDDNISMDGIKSQANSEADMASDEEEYETITVSEAAPDESIYDQDIDMIEEKEAMEKIKRKFEMRVKKTVFNHLVIFCRG